MGGCGKLFCCSTGETNDHHKQRHHHHGKQEAQKPELDASKYSDFINRARIKIRSVSNIRRGRGSAYNNKTDGAHAAKNEDHTKDVFSEYIQRVKVRIRRTATGGNTFKGAHAGKTG